MNNGEQNSKPETLSLQSRTSALVNLTLWKRISKLNLSGSMEKHLCKDISYKVRMLNKEKTGQLQRYTGMKTASDTRTLAFCQCNTSKQSVKNLIAMQRC